MARAVAARRSSAGRVSTRIERGAVTERTVVKAAADGVRPCWDGAPC